MLGMDLPTTIEPRRLDREELIRRLVDELADGLARTDAADEQAHGDQDAGERADTTHETERQ